VNQLFGHNRIRTMAILSATVLALLVTCSAAQSTSANASIEHVWSSVAWVLHGERTPLWGPALYPALTPLGAQQMFAQGSLLRDRYLREDPEEKDATFAPIIGIERNAIDNTQLTILTNTDPYMVTSAQAFVQGLYPPILQAFSENSGGIAAARFANGSIVNYPLQGYQYPAFRTVSPLDFESIWVNGHVGCTKYTESLLDFASDDVVATIYNNTHSFYQKLWAEVLNEVFPLSMANFANAYLLYDYAQFRWTHSNSTRNNMNEDELRMMARFASTEQRNKNANLSASGSNQGDMIRAVSGRTMAAKTLAYLRDNIRLGGTVNKINIAFTTLETFVAWFGLSGLVTGDHMAEFKPLPEQGGMMVLSSSPSAVAPMRSPRMTTFGCASSIATAPMAAIISPRTPSLTTPWTASPTRSLWPRSNCLTLTRCRTGVHSVTQCRFSVTRDPAAPHLVALLGRVLLSSPRLRVPLALPSPLLWLVSCS